MAAVMGPYSPDEVAHMRAHYAERGAAAVAAALGRPVANIHKKARALGLRCTPPDQRAHKISAKGRSELRARRAAGESLSSLAGHFGVAPTAILYHVRDIPNPPRKPPGNRRVDPAVLARLAAQRLSGATIAERLGVHRATVYIAARRHGVALAPPRKVAF